MNPELRERMIEATKTAKGLSPGEMETGIHFGRRDTVASVHTEEPALVRRLLGHPEFEVDYFVQETADGYVRIPGEEAAERFDGRRRLVSVDGTIPIGCLKVSANPRSSTGHAGVVSDATSLEGQADD